VVQVQMHKASRFLASGAAQESNLPSDGLRRLTGFEVPRSAVELA
jgi:hypothetical protein